MNEVVISRFFAGHYVADGLPRNTRVETEPAYKVMLRIKKQREDKRRKRARSPLIETLLVQPGPPALDTVAT
jgi:hypothetical protein